MLTENEILESLKSVIDAEVGVNVVDLGLVYRAEADRDGIRVVMTMTSMTCPLGEHIRHEAELALRNRFPEMKSVAVEITWDPPWSPAMMSEAAKRQLGG